jgi:3'(2'), 5'-bisphosphate nucleotidase
VRPGAHHAKPDRSPVTVADFGSQALVCRALAEAYPRDPVVGEEDAASLRESALLPQVVDHVRRFRPDADAAAVCAWIDRGAARDTPRRFWTLDPIDGTKGFLRGEHYAVALALVVDGEPAVAAMACPGLDAIVSAIAGAGAWAEPIGGGARTPIRVAATSDPTRAGLLESVEKAHSDLDAQAAIAQALGVTKIMAMDSQAKYAALARGDADIYLRLPTGGGYVEKIWDHAAGACVLRAAGGRVSDADGAPLDFRRGAVLDRNRGIVATNGALHDAVLAAVAAAK